MAEPSIRVLQPTHVQYEPLPFETNAPTTSPPASPGPYDSPIPMEELPAGAGRPRFQGAALREDGSRARESFASSSTYNAGTSINSSVYALNPPGPGNRSSAYLDAYRDDPHGSYQDETELSPEFADRNSNKYLDGKRSTYLPPQNKSRKWTYIAGGLLLLVVAIVAVVVPIYFTVIKKDNKDDSSSIGGSPNPTSSGSPNDGGSVRAISGGDGSTVTMDDGTTFTFKNAFGGTWYSDPKDPFNNAARAQSWSPALNETFKYGTDIIRGVNLGGWLVTEPFMQVLLRASLLLFYCQIKTVSFHLRVPALYEPYVNATVAAVDEWTLSQNMRSDTSNGGISQLENHYKTFITEKDFAQIAAAGLNFARIPVPYWAIEVRGDEPFLANTCWTYFLKAIQWARKYGLRINLDFHALPGSQNGWNHSGKLGTINVLNGPMGYANAQRSLDYIRIFAEFISQPEYKDVVVMFGITNEPQPSTFGMDQLKRYYLQSYDLVRTAGGTGAGNGPFVSYHDGFQGQNNWAGFLPGADRISLDTHPYLCFATQSSNPLSSFVKTPCTAWGANMNTSMSAFGLSAAGEFSNAINDCGLYVNGVGLGTRYEGTYPGTWPVIGTCDDWLDYENWNATIKQNYKSFALSSMDALQNYFFWTWKIGNSTVYNKVMAPQWSYQLGLENGWMPTDPRDSTGQCGGGNVWVGPLAPSATGGSGTAQIPASVSSSLSWPPATISNGGAVTDLPSYTPTGSVPTLTGPTFTATSSKSMITLSAGDGWENSADTAGLMTDIAGCSYLDPWIGPNASPPSPLCSSSAAKRDDMPEPKLTAVPTRR
ncbi:hypothetical protein EW145_g3869 [Phellinidium pouzarii]|uniref:glucan 1,3-beta-glucosidase n=1 Tax=Phellinidium pouzarii TaxID=167371 RepID=A0A4S4L7F3_9AGAM|nr:hypothetical protein EW145_g3869 [Phellinidium pouzarii]